MIRAVIFDLGHTLWDIGSQRDALPNAYASMRRTLVARLGREDLPEAQAIQEAVNKALHAASETYFQNSARVDQPPSHEWIDRGCRALGIELDAALLREITPPLFATEIENLICADGTATAVTDLARDYALGCVTNTLSDEAAIRAMLRKFELEQYMRSVVVSADEGWRKPHASLFEKAMRELGVAPSEAVFVGDSPLHDIMGAKACGMRAVLTRQYVTRPTDGYDPPADAIIEHLRELRGVIKRFDAGGVATGDRGRPKRGQAG